MGNMTKDELIMLRSKYNTTKYSGPMRMSNWVKALGNKTAGSKTPRSR